MTATTTTPPKTTMAATTTTTTTTPPTSNHNHHRQQRQQQQQQQRQRRRQQKANNIPTQQQQNNDTRKQRKNNKGIGWLAALQLSTSFFFILKMKCWKPSVFLHFHLWTAFREYHFVLRGPIQNEESGISCRRNDHFLPRRGKKWKCLLI